MFSKGFFQKVVKSRDCAEKSQKELQESMHRCTGRRDITEILLKTALSIIQSIIQSTSRSRVAKSVTYRISSVRSPARPVIFPRIYGTSSHCEGFISPLRALPGISACKFIKTSDATANRILVALMYSIAPHPPPPKKKKKKKIKRQTA